MTLLTLEQVTRRFGGLVAVNSVDLRVERGGVTAVIGPNGAGKTTLFHLISGFQRPDEGRVLLEGHDITGLPPERIAAQGLVRTFQLVQLFRDLSAHENVAVGCHLQTSGGLLAALLRTRSVRQTEQEVAVTSRELLSFVGLETEGDVMAGALTYGQQRLLEIARALAAKPKLLLLDEPAAGLNAQESRLLSATIRKIVARGTTVLLIEHDMNLVMSTADTVAVLDFGAKIAEGTPASVRANPAVIAAYLGSAEAARA
ncbi:MAG: ABC transporter ATP-binding protein [Hyphomicrobiales bacterium]|nr:ABC transporter ATP-binding protein [Hyphomicrobiales bacterium]